MSDPDFIKNVLSTLPGVDPSSEAIQKVMVTLAQQDCEDGKDKDKDEPMDEEGTSNDKEKDKKWQQWTLYVNTSGGSWDDSEYNRTFFFFSAKVTAEFSASYMVNELFETTVFVLVSVNTSVP